MPDYFQNRVENDRQEGVKRGMWMSRDGLIYIEDMTDVHVVNAFKTCQRHESHKTDEVYRELELRKLDWMVGR